MKFVRIALLGMMLAPLCAQAQVSSRVLPSTPRQALEEISNVLETSVMRGQGGCIIQVDRRLTAAAGGPMVRVNVKGIGSRGQLDQVEFLLTEKSPGIKAVGTYRSRSSGLRVEVKTNYSGVPDTNVLLVTYNSVSVTQFGRTVTCRL